VGSTVAGVIEEGGGALAVAPLAPYARMVPVPDPLEDEVETPTYAP